MWVAASEMSMSDEARIHLELEMPGIEAWAARHGWKAAIDLDELTVRAEAPHPNATNTSVQFIGEFSNYRQHPPTWKCLVIEGGSPSSAFPAAGVISNGPPSSIFHGSKIICAPWSAGAYAEKGGPHGDWISLNNWLSVLPPHSQAHSIADMLSAFELHLSASPGLIQ